MELIISHVTYSSPKYQQIWDLREEVLRKPLGMSLKDEDLSRHHNDIFFIAEHNQQVVGCVLLHHVGDAAKLRAMAVYDAWQGKGVGRLLVQAFEAYAQNRGYKKVVLHARKVALGFYESMDYQITSDEFTEVGIPHYEMEKELKPPTP